MPYLMPPLSTLAFPPNRYNELTPHSHLLDISVWSALHSDSWAFCNCYHSDVSVLQLTISVWGKDEEVIDKPIAPSDIKKILYDRCFPFDPIQAVLQQELIINIGTFITTSPEYFRGILKIRIGYCFLPLLPLCVFLRSKAATAFNAS